MRCKCGAGLGQQVAARAGGNVIEDHGPVRCVRDGGIVGDQPALRSLIVVGRHHQTGICSGGAGKPRQLDGFFGAVCAGACDDRHAPGGPLYGKGDRLAVLLGGHCGRLARCAAGDKPGDAAFDLPVYESAVGVIVDGAGRCHRGGKRRGDAAEKCFLFHLSYLLFL